MEAVALELLAPAKDLQTGMAAIDHGADAVYIAAERYGAREKAGNPTNDIASLCAFAHRYYAKVYVTVNTVLFDTELKDAENLITELTDAGADAIIIQDFSVLKMSLPPVAIHASTQMHNNTAEKIRFLEDCGIRRVVLPRELSVNEIRKIRENTRAELECFIHGALCVSYSGQCYMSHYLTGRSANRGACVQPCRSSYDLINESGKILFKDRYLLSLKDLNLSGQIGMLIDAGITSFKIEGRMKDAGYVKNAVAFYSNILNSEISTRKGFKRSSSGKCIYNFVPDPTRSFNRGFIDHFSEGRKKDQSSFLTQKATGKKVGTVIKSSAEWIIIKTEEKIVNGDGLCFFNGEGKLDGFNVNMIEGEKIFTGRKTGNISKGTEIFRNFDSRFEKELAGKSSERRIDVFVKASVAGKKLILRATDSDRNCFKLSPENEFEQSRNPQLAEENLKTQLSKSGDTIFKICEVNSEDIINPLHIPVSVLNGFRRSLLEGLLLERLNNYVKPEPVSPKPGNIYPAGKIDYRGNITNKKSREFLSERGVEEISDGFEIEKPGDDAILMETRYCIKYEVGICPSKQAGKPSGRLYLKDNKHTYPLDFDCRECVMRIGLPVKSTK
jgi:putative protease